MPRVPRRPLAATDIAEIWDYIAEDSIEQADAWVDRLDETLQLLATQPRMGRARDELSHVGCAACRLAVTSSSMSHWTTASMSFACCTQRVTSTRSSLRIPRIHEELQRPVPPTARPMSTYCAGRTRPLRRPSLVSYPLV
jgi:plasmid stabilization system protein ParE